MEPSPYFHTLNYLPMSIIKKMLAAFGLAHEKSEALTLPQDKPKKKATKTDAMPDNIQLTKTGLFKVTRGDDGAEWERVKDKKEASLDGLTPDEIQLLKDRNLSKDLVRAAEFKRVWSSKISAKDACKITGMGQRTMEKYWSVFNMTAKTRKCGK